jgi:hypothetical protein
LFEKDVILRTIEEYRKQGYTMKACFQKAAAAVNFSRSIESIKYTYYEERKALKRYRELTGDYSDIQN